MSCGEARRGGAAGRSGRRGEGEGEGRDPGGQGRSKRHPRATMCASPHNTTPTRRRRRIHLVGSVLACVGWGGVECASGVGWAWASVLEGGGGCGGEGGVRVRVGVCVGVRG